MSWAALISALISVFGPFLKDLIQKWIDKHFNNSATSLGDIAKFGTEVAARDALFDNAIQTAGGPLRRQALRWMKQQAAKNNIASTNIPVLQASHGAVLHAMGHSLSREISRSDEQPETLPPVPPSPTVGVSAPILEVPDPVTEEEALDTPDIEEKEAVEAEMAKPPESPPSASEKPGRRGKKS